MAPRTNKGQVLIELVVISCFFLSLILVSQWVYQSFVKEFNSSKFENQ